MVDSYRGKEFPPLSDAEAADILNEAGAVDVATVGVENHGPVAELTQPYATENVVAPGVIEDKDGVEVVGGNCDVGIADLECAPRGGLMEIIFNLLLNPAVADR